MDKLNKLKQERDNLEKLLENATGDRADSLYLLKELQPIFSRIDVMTSYQPLGRIRYVRFVMESGLSDNTEFLNCYGRFANLVEGLEV